MPGTMEFREHSEEMDPAFDDVNDAESLMGYSRSVLRFGVCEMGV